MTSQRTPSENLQRIRDEGIQLLSRWQDHVLPDLIDQASQEYGRELRKGNSSNQWKLSFGEGVADCAAQAKLFIEYLNGKRTCFALKTSEAFTAMAFRLYDSDNIDVQMQGQYHFRIARRCATLQMRKEWNSYKEQRLLSRREPGDN